MEQARGVLPSKRLLGMCRWMVSHFHNWTDYNGVMGLINKVDMVCLSPVGYGV